MSETVKTNSARQSDLGLSPAEIDSLVAGDSMG
jgi:hypothetical protein